MPELTQAVVEALHDKFNPLIGLKIHPGSIQCRRNANRQRLSERHKFREIEAHTLSSTTSFYAKTPHKLGAV